MDKKLLRNIADWMYLFIDSIISIILIILFSSPKKKLPYLTSLDDDCIILANGPSLRNDINKIETKFSENVKICMNLFALSDFYCTMKPKYYVLLEPDFWNNKLSGKPLSLRERLFEAIISKTTWEMIIFFPIEMADSVILRNSGLSKNKMITVKFFNRTSVKGFSVFRHLIYKKGLGVPPPRNVLVMSIFLCLNIGFKNIFIFGADHSWHENFFVGVDNLLYIDQKHFYDKHKKYSYIYKIPPTSDSDGEIFKVHELFEAWAKMFRSYWLLKEYSEYLGSTIYNCSSKTYIDAFKRQEC